jgi:hypothetical protein
MPLAGSGGSDTGGGVSPLPAKSLVPYVRGFRFTAAPATFGSSLPGLRRFAQFAFSLAWLPWVNLNVLRLGERERKNYLVTGETENNRGRLGQQA